MLQYDRIPSNKKYSSEQFPPEYHGTQSIHEDHILSINNCLEDHIPSNNKTKDKQTPFDRPYEEVFAFHHAHEMGLFNKYSYKVVISIGLSSSCIGPASRVFDIGSTLLVLREDMVESDRMSSIRVYK